MLIHSIVWIMRLLFPHFYLRMVIVSQHFERSKNTVSAEIFVFYFSLASSCINAAHFIAV